MKRKAGRVDRNDVKARAAAMRQKKAAAEAAKQKAAAAEEAKRQRSMMPPPPPMAPKPKQTRTVTLPAEPAPPAPPAKPPAGLPPTLRRQHATSAARTRADNFWSFLEMVAAGKLRVRRESQEMSSEMSSLVGAGAPAARPLRAAGSTKHSSKGHGDMLTAGTASVRSKT